MKIIFILLVLLIFAASFVVMKLKGATGPSRTGAYRRRKLMTDNEAEFFGRLVSALPDHYVFPQVAMSALLETASSDKRTAHADRLRIAQQRADYVICGRSCEVVAVVELDDKTHTRTKDELRDARLEQAGIRTVRFQARNKPKVEAIRALILGATGDGVEKAMHETAVRGAAAG
ncbi:MAG: DUF2726 domain-containing protein [Massilia sp.]